MLIFFYEQGVNLLREGGVLTLITSNKYYRAAYGSKLRPFLAGNLTFCDMVDFGDASVFEAIAYASILIGLKRNPPANHTIRACTWPIGEGFEGLRQTLSASGIELAQRDLAPDGWRLESPAAIRLLEKLRAKGTPLGEYVGGRFYYGTKTGPNEAFVIDTATRARLIAEDPKSAELIKPWIRGKDIRRWTHDNPDLYSIAIASSENASHPWSLLSETDALKKFRETYPALAEHLLTHRKKLVARTDQGRFFWELRSCDYWKAFEEPKIVFNETSKRLHAYLDTGKNAINKTGFIILTKDAGFVLAVLNSSVLDWLYRSTFPARGDPWNTGRVQFRGNLIQRIPIPPADAATKAKLSEPAGRAAELAAQESGIGILACDSKTSQTGMSVSPLLSLSEVEREIDAIVYRLFDLTPAEIALIETALAQVRSRADTSQDE